VFGPLPDEPIVTHLLSVIHLVGGAIDVHGCPIPHQPAREGGFRRLELHDKDYSARTLGAKTVVRKCSDHAAPCELHVLPDS
jgi:hypothetical protein